MQRRVTQPEVPVNNEIAPLLSSIFCVSIQKIILRRACSFSTFFVALSMRRALSSWVGAIVILTGRGRARNTSNAMHSLSEGVVLLNTSTVISQHS